MAAHRSIDVRRFDLEAARGAGRASTHDYHVLGLVTAGSGTMWLGAAHQLRAGDLMLIPEAAPHYTIEARGCRLWGMALCASCMDPSWGAPLARAFAGVRGGASPVRPIAAPAELEHHFEQLAVELDATDAARDLAIAGRMALVAATIARAAPAVAPAQPTTPLVARAVAVIEARALEGISLADVAAEVGRAPAHLAAVVKRETGRTVVEWITRIRMAHARRLLATSDETIEAIAARAGFASASHFHRTFRRAHELTPSRWRRLHRAV